MSFTSSVPLNEEQKKFLSSLEEEFKDRYTEKDEEFKAALEEVPPPPPIVENWGDFRQCYHRYNNYPYRTSHHSYERQNP